jgi:hypothetical protein
MKLRPPNITVLGLFPDQIQAESAIEALVSATFPESKLSILIPDKPITTDFDFEKNSKAPEGAVTGGVVGGTLGILWGAGVFAIPGIGPFLAAGPITAMLAGLGAGTTTGAVIGALVGIGIPEFEAKRYEQRLKAGLALVTVHCENSDEAERAKKILEQNGSAEIGTAHEA